MYITLLNYTEQGAKDIKNALQRVASARRAVEAAGGKIHAFYLTMGQYDAVTVIELPSDEAAATNALAVGAQGNVRTTTMRAFTEEEMAGIVSNLP
tara:strand:+ start:903 stop:1190 length:288 start_codon:yes stop_codon:yes gene_type:complete